MEFTAEQKGDGITLVTLAGRLDIDGTDQIDLKFNTLAAEDYACVIADLSGVTFMSTIGIGTLVRVAKSVRRRGGNLVILNPQPLVRMVLEKTRINEFIALSESYPAAVAAVKEAPPGPLKF